MSRTGGSGRPCNILAAGGKRGLVKLIHPRVNLAFGEFRASRRAISIMRFSPRNASFLFSEWSNQWTQWDFSWAILIQITKNLYFYLQLGRMKIRSFCGILVDWIVITTLKSGCLFIVQNFLILNLELIECAAFFFSKTFAFSQTYPLHLYFFISLFFTVSC